MPVTSAVPKTLTDSEAPIVALYVYGVFDSNDWPSWPSFPTWIGYIQDSPFNTVVFSTFHVDSAGNLYGSVPLVRDGVFNPNGELNPELPALYTGLRQSGKTLLYSIGNSSGTTGDLAALSSILDDPFSPTYSNLLRNMAVLRDTLGIELIDFDFEGDYSARAQRTVTAFTTFCRDLDLGVTYCPYQQEQFWIDAQIAAAADNSPVRWWNQQCYPGLSTPEAWLPAIEANAEAMRVSDPAAFLVPGTVVSLGTSGVEQQFSQWAEAVPGLNGGFIWQFGNLGLTSGSNPCPPWAEAVLVGLANPAAAQKRQSR